MKVLTYQRLAQLWHSLPPTLALLVPSTRKISNIKLLNSPDIAQFFGINSIFCKFVSFTYPSVVIVTMVYQKDAGMLVNLLELDPFSA